MFFVHLEKLSFFLNRKAPHYFTSRPDVNVYTDENVTRKWKYFL